MSSKSMSKQSRLSQWTRYHWFISMTVIVSVISILFLQQGQVQGAPANPVVAAWEQAQRRGGYHFTTDLSQTTTPLATLNNVGRSSRQTNLHLEGATDLHAGAMHLHLWSQDGSVSQPNSGVEVRVINGKTQMRQSGSADAESGWQEAGDLLGGMAPNGDFLAFLSGMRAIEPVGTETRAGITFTRYRFQLAGPAIADHIRAQMEATLRQRGELPTGMALQTPTAYAQMTGSGELWIDQHGLPLRQLLDLQFPAQRAEVITAHVVTHFSDFAAPRATALLSSEQLARLATFAVSLFCGLLAVATVLLGRRSRPLYVALILAVIFGEVAGPLLQNWQITKFFDVQHARAAAQEREQATQTAIRTAYEQTTETNFNPNRDPIAAADAQAQAAAFSANAALVLPPAPTPAPLTAPDTSVDSDQDGLTDFVEERIGTNQHEADTDDDNISDGVEVKGFAYSNGSRRWFGDPWQIDSNNDGQADTLEWLNDANSDGLPDDTDGDGTPDAFDEDNDGDGVPDQFDLSPYRKMAPAADATFNDATPFQFQLNHLQAGNPVMVDFQLRPNNDKHLWYALNVLDWPHDIEGQIQDGDGKTFADLPNSDPKLSPNDANGDLKLIPMLEIRTATDAANLPAPSQLLAYSIVTHTVTSDGANQVIYVPLQLTTDSKTGARLAFSGRMPYFATGSWSQPHQVRLVWLVQALLDLCETQQKDGTCHTYRQNNHPEVLQSYYDDWTLTGLSVREDHGAQTALIFEDPAHDADIKDDAGLVKLAYGLEHSFLAGRDQEPDGQLDVTLGNIDGAAARWGIGETFQTVKGVYSTFDEAVMTTAMTTTKQILNGNFKQAWTADHSLKPLLLFAHEEVYRNEGLDSLHAGGAAQQQGALLTIDFNPAGKPSPQQTSVGLKWTMFCGDATTGDWQGCEATTLWDELYTRYAAHTRLTVNGVTDNETSGQARLSLIRLYFLAMSQGASTIVKEDATVLAPRDGFLNDSATGAMIRGGGQLGKGVVAFAVSIATTKWELLTNDIIQKIADLSAPSSYIDTLGIGGIFVTKFKAASKSAQVGIIGAIVGVVIIAVALAATLSYFLATDPALRDTVLTTALTKVVPIVAIIVPLGGLAAGIVPLVQLAKSLQQGVSSVPKLLRGSSALMGTTRTSLVVGAVIQVAVIWGIFIYQMVESNTAFFSPQFNAALAQAIAATVLTILLTVLSAVGIGLVIVTVLAVIDAILIAICQYGVEELKEVPGLNGACFTLNTAATAGLAKLLYSFDTMVDTENEKLVVSDGLAFSLANPARGLVANNPLSFTLGVTTTVVHKDPKPQNWMHILPYIWLFDESNIRGTTFKYELAQTSGNVEAERHQMDGDWKVSEREDKFIGKTMYQAETRVTATIQNINLSAGINQAPNLYLNTGYALPAYECWAVPNPVPPYTPPGIPVCYTRSLSDHNATAISQYKLDILPPTLDQFMALSDAGDGGLKLNWDAQFLTLVDADGDGLRASARQGNDPDDNAWDADGDGLSDAVELAWRTQGVNVSPLNPDTDRDELTDGQELQLGTDPTRKDTDNDSLLDSEELYHQVYTRNATGAMTPSNQWRGGWTVAITGTQPIAIIVSSDPTAPDSDDDGISDQAEKALAENSNLSQRLDPDGRPYHPLIVNKNPLVVRVAVNDVDRIVKPGQALVYNTNVTNLGAPLAAGSLAVRAPELLSAPLSTYRLELDQTNSVTKTTSFVVANASAQQININSFASARLINTTPVTWTWSTVQTGTLGTFQSTFPYYTAVAPVNATSQENYAVTALTQNRAKENSIGWQDVFRGDVWAWNMSKGQSKPLEEDDNNISALRNNTGAEVACNDDGQCLYVWDQYDNCQTVTVKWAAVTENKDESNGADLALYVLRNTDFLHPGETAAPRLWYDADIGTGMNNARSINKVQQFCGPSFSFALWEYDDDALLPAENPNNGSQYKMYPLPLYMQSTSPGPETWRFRGKAEQDIVDATIEINRTPEKSNVIMGALAGQQNTLLPVQKPQFALTANLQDTESLDFRPVVASDGNNFLVAWERVTGGGAGNVWTMQSQIVTRRYAANGNPLGDEVVLTPMTVATNLDHFARQSFLTLDVAWIGDAYRVVWKNSYDGSLHMADFTADGAPIAAGQHLVATNATWDVTQSPSLAYDPISGRILLAVRNASHMPLVILFQNRSDATGILLPNIANGQISNIAVAYEPGIHGWLILWLLYPGPTKDLGYLLLKPDGSPMTQLTQQVVRWAEFPFPNLVSSLACPAPASQPVLALPFEELPGVTSFADTSGWNANATCSGDSCPLAGVAGAPGAPLSDYGVQFNGAQKLTVAVPGLRGNRFSLAFWLKTSATTGYFPLVTTDQWHAMLNNGYVTYQSDNVFPPFPVSNVRNVADEQWHHIAVTQDANVMTVYVDSQAESMQATLSPNTAAQGNLTIGGSANSAAFLTGAIDHLLVYNTVLDQATVQAIMNRQQNSYCLATSPASNVVNTVKLGPVAQDTRGGPIKRSAGLTLTVDADPPTSSVTSLVDGGYIQGVPGSDQTLIIGGSANDAYGIQQVNVQINNGGFQPATGAATWVYPLQVREGRYAIQSQAIDAAGNRESAPRTTTVIVDAGAPQVTTAFADHATLQPQTMPNQRWQVALQGAVNDPPVGGDPGSGVSQVEVLLQSADLNTAGNGWQTATLANTGWQLNYDLPSAPTLSGFYTVTVRATDRVGNLTTLARPVYLDQAGPTAALNNLDAARSVLVSPNSAAVNSSGLAVQPLTINGVASDMNGVNGVDVAFVPIQRLRALSDTLLFLSLDDPINAVTYYDRSPLHGAVSCLLPCVAGEPGPGGRPNDKAVRLLINEAGPMERRQAGEFEFAANTNFSLQSWLRTSQSDGVILSQEDAAQTGYALILQGGKVALRLNGAHVAQTETLVNDNQWHQIVGVVEGEAGRVLIYIDGALSALGNFNSMPFNWDGSHPSLLIGGQHSPQGVGSQIEGWFAEVGVFKAALSPFLVQALYKNVGAGWAPATVTPSGAVSTTWTMVAPDGLEGQYQLDLRTTDGLGNQSQQGAAWRGTIDNLAPRLHFTATATGRQFTDGNGVTHFEVAYSYAADDQNLNDATFSGPCSGHSTVVRGFAANADVAGLFPDLTLRNQLSTSCNVWETSPTPAATVSACDIYGQCATANPTQADADLVVSSAANLDAVDANAPSALLLAPTNQSIVALRADAVLTVTFSAKAEQTLRNVVILLDNAPVQTIDFAQADAIKAVQRTVGVPLANINLDQFEGVHTLTVQASDWGGNEQQTRFPVNVTVDTHDPTIVLENDKLTDADGYALGNNMVRLHGTSGDTLGLSAVQISVNGAPFQDVTFDETGRWRTALWLDDEPAGQIYQFTVRASDRAGRMVEARKDLLVDKQPRAFLRTTINSGPAKVTNETATTFTFSGVDANGGNVTTFQCQLDGGDYTPCSSPLTYHALSGGDHIFRVLSDDGKGTIDPTPVEWTWTVDLNRPQQQVYLPTVMYNEGGRSDDTPVVDESVRLYLPLIQR